MLRICAGFVLVWMAAAAAALEGPVRVVDGDTLEVAGEVVRLHGIDAPEAAQRCTGPGGGRWACGTWSGAVLAELVARGRLSCTGIERDRYGRLVARCRAGGVDVAEAMVRRGAAFAYRRYSLDYVAAERLARRDGLGLWQGGAARPADWRRGDTGPDPEAPEGCPIKGNISDNGRIYHRPGQAHYARTRIATSRGERWFCSEAEARAAGWRPARR
jgi:endonuclease YncB( thermonuclease family)